MTTSQSSEKYLQNLIIAHLTDTHKYKNTKSKDFDVSHCMNTKELLGFIQDSQPEMYSFIQAKGEKKFLDIVDDLIKAEDILYIMRKGVKYYDKTIFLFYPEPVSTINTLDIERFKKNRFSTTDELIYSSSHKNEIDPLLHTMYVDKKLEGVQAVQTLSRLNRSYPPFKEDTFVLDFYNKAEDIKKEFEKYYTTTILSEETDPNDLNVIQRILDTFNKRFAGYTWEEKNKSTEILAEAILQATRKNLEEGLAL